MTLPGFIIEGMADTSYYDAITAQSAFDALHTAEEFLCEIFSLRQISDEDLPHAMHAWTGRPA
jgi:hypothetical protein